MAPSLVGRMMSKGGAVQGHVNKRLVFLCSGGGGNLSFLHHAIREGAWHGGEIVGVLTDRHCMANEFSERVGLYNRVVSLGGATQHELTAQLEQLRPDLIITTVHKILCPAVVAQYRDRLVNLHYSLLPAFAGLIGSAPVLAALHQQLLFSGVTVHLVDERVDAGRPLVQVAIALVAGDSLDNLMPVVFRCGCIALARALTQLSGGGAHLSSAAGLEVSGRACLFNGGVTAAENLLGDERFWGRVQLAVKQ
ncbi:formyltransferase family protein [Pseudomonas sp. NBRC 111133]|uniref:formyltransferase family protein n=1 Tax=Pseudomonas sp. NBRC 111133 TaxID=1661048 RepID=UPI0009E691A9|nr:formyltransferase family protein [Pseudomonas sp. NBRC 111133]